MVSHGSHFVADSTSYTSHFGAAILWMRQSHGIRISVVLASLKGLGIPETEGEGVFFGLAPLYYWAQPEKERPREKGPGESPWERCPSAQFLLCGAGNYLSSE